MTLGSFTRRGDLVDEINRLGALYDIKSEFIHNQHIYMLCCSTQLESKCEARILGMYSQQDKMFHIRRLETIHSCSKNIKKESALQYEIQKPRYSGMRLGQIVEAIYPKFKAGYLEVYRAYSRVRGGIWGEQKENRSNTVLGSTMGTEFPSDGFFVGERGIESMFCSTDYPKKDGSACQDPDEMVADCLASLKDEFESLNKGMGCRASESSFFFKHIQMGDHLRDVSELKVYSRHGRTVIFGLLFDPCDDHIVQSCMVSDEPKTRALEAFIDWDSQVSNPGHQQFFIVDPDGDVMQVLKSKGVPFFIKSRSVSLYLQESKEDDPGAFEYFTELNYGDKEFLEIEKSLYLKRHCPKQMFNLNNAHAPDFEFVTPLMLSLSLVDCATALIWLVHDDLKTRKTFSTEDAECRLPEAIVDFLEECSETEPRAEYEADLERAYCGCGKFQENLFPCIHACKKIRGLGQDPLMYVSSVYSKDNLLRIHDISPVVNIRMYPQKAKAVQKKRKSDMSNAEDACFDARESHGMCRA